MKLILNPLITYYKAPTRELYTKILGIIHELECLYDLKNLSDEELKEIIKKYYRFDIEYFNSCDIARIAKSVLKRGEVEFDVVSTSIITEVIAGEGELSNLDAVVYYPANSDFDTEHVYTGTELRELIESRKIVVLPICT